MYLVPGGVSGPGRVPGQGVYLPWGHLPGGVPDLGEYLPRYCPSVNRMTNRCKNITLPQTSFAGVKNARTVTLPILYNLK